MNKDEKEKSAGEPDFNPRNLVGCRTKDMAAAYDRSVQAYRRDIAVIKHKLDAEQQKLRPGCKRGGQGYTFNMVLIVVEHLGIPKKK